MINRIQFEEHVELHREILAHIKANTPPKIPYYFDKELSLKDVHIDEDGCIIAEYSRYKGCGEYDTETVYLDAAKYFIDESNSED